MALCKYLFLHRVSVPIVRSQRLGLRLPISRRGTNCFESFINESTQALRDVNLWPLHDAKRRSEYFALFMTDQCENMRIRKRPKRRREKLGLGPEALLLQGHERTGKIVRMRKESNYSTSSVLGSFADEGKVRENGIIPQWRKKIKRNAAQRIVGILSL